MFSHFWKRLFGAAEDSKTHTEAALVAPERTTAIAAPTVTAPPRVTEPSRDDPAAVEAHLHRSLHWRSKVLMEGASKEASPRTARRWSKN